MLLNIKGANLNEFLELNDFVIFPCMSKCIILIQNMWLKYNHI